MNERVAADRRQPRRPDGNRPNAASRESRDRRPDADFSGAPFWGKLQGRKDAIVGDDLVQLVLIGGFPEAISRDSERRRQDWAQSYLTSILTRDLRDIADVETAHTGGLR